MKIYSIKEIVNATNNLLKFVKLRIKMNNCQIYFDGLDIKLNYRNSLYDK